MMAGIRWEIMVFAEVMEKVMTKHDLVKGDSWKEMSFDELQKRLLEEVEETERFTATLSEWVDVANICMMIYHHALTKVQPRRVR